MARHSDKAMEASVREAKKKDKTNDQLIDTAIDALFRSPDGREFINWLLEVTGVNTQPFAGDPYMTAFKCGELNVGNAILARFTTVTPEGYIALLKERNENGKSNDPGSDDIRDTPGDTASDTGSDYLKYD